MRAFTTANVLFLQSCLSLLASSSPAPTAMHKHLAPREPQITPSPVDLMPSRTKDKRGVISDLSSKISSYVSSVDAAVDSWENNVPTGSAVASTLGLESSDLAALPTNVLNLDPYANWTDAGWNVRFHGNVYKQPNTSVEKLNSLANIFLINTSISDLPASQQDQARNLTAEIFVVQQGDVNVSTILLEPAASNGASGDSDGGGGITATGGTQDITLPYPTTPEGDFDVFVPILSNGLTAGNATTSVQKLNTFVTNTTLGNSTAYLVPPTGLTIVSDIDDILRVTKIYEPAQGLLNTFAKPFVPWDNMPSIYANWSSSIAGAHFHYLTTTPEQVTRNYMEFIYANYPGGSFDTRPLNFSDIGATVSIRKFLLQKVFETFPERKFVLVADTSNSDVMRDYPAMATEFPGQVQCILLRNTTNTDPGDQLPYDTSGFKSLNQSQYMFFVTPSDLTNLDIASGHCYNTSVPQNLTFSEQGLPLDLSSTTSVNGSANHTAGAGRLLAAGGDSWGIIGGWGNAAVTVAMLGAFWGLL